MKPSILARRPEDLSGRWVQRVIDRRHPGVRVTRSNIVSVDVGTTTRIRLAVEHDGPDTLPRRWFVKLPSLAWRARFITALPRLLHTEIRFYTEAAPAVPILIPEILAAQSRPGQGAILVLQDVAESGGVAGSPGDVLTAAQAALVITQLARFHARFHARPDLAKTLQWLAGPVRRLEDHLGTILAAPLMKRGLQQAAELIPSSLHGQAMRYARQRRQVMHFLSNASQTLVHHDCHPGNLFWGESRPGLLDWQLVRFGEGIGDVAYFLATSLNPAIRRTHESSLLSLYAQTLEEHGSASMDMDNLLQRYRAHLIYPFEAMVISLAVGGMIPPEANRTLIFRTAAAIHDLDAFSALPI